MLKIKKRDLIKVIQDLQAELRPRLLNSYQVCPNDKPWLENEPYVRADAFLARLNTHKHCWESWENHVKCFLCCECDLLISRELLADVTNFYWGK